MIPITAFCAALTVLVLYCCCLVLLAVPVERQNWKWVDTSVPAARRALAIATVLLLPPLVLSLAIIILYR